MKNFSILLISFLFSFIINAQIIDIPDANFKNALVNTNCCNTGGAYTDADLNNDGEIQVSEALQVSSMNVNNESITSLTGIEYFSNLGYLNCDSNNLTSLDVSEFVNLTGLSCSSNQITSLNLSNLTNLSYLSCNNNFLTSLDLSGMVNLDDLNCRDNQLTSLEISDSVNMRWLDCRNNQLSNLDITSYTSLWDLNCQNNLLTSLIIPNLLSLQVVDCADNQLTSLTINDETLLGLTCDNNLLTSLDLSSMTSLKNLRCSDNTLTSLNLGSMSLENINCNNNQLINLDLTSLTDLETVYCTNNQLTSIDFPIQAAEFNSLYCSDNNLSSLDVGNLTGLVYLNCQNNVLNSLNSGTGLSTLQVSNNELVTIDLSNSPNLYDLYANNNLLTSIDLSNSQILEELHMSNNLFTSIDFSNCTNLNTIFLENNLLTSIDVSQNFNLCNFYCDNNDFTTINFGDIDVLCAPWDVFFDGSPNLSVVCTIEDNFGWVQDKLTEYGYSDCAITSYCSFEPNSEYFLVQGQALIDVDSNGCDVSDAFATNQGFNISSNDFYDTFYANSQSEFELYISSGSHTITPAFENPDYFTVSPSSITVNFPTDISPFIQDFCITPNGTHNDLEITLFPLDEARPGFDTDYKIVYKNKGTTTLSGDIDFGFQDEVMDYVTATPPNESVLSDLLSWSFTDLTPFESREIYLTMNINSPMETPPVNGDDILSFTTTISSSETDETPDDNTFQLNQTVVNSFDPNDKTCLEGDVISPEMVGEYVHYMIRFENTGTANAINVVVKDHIDRTKYDLSSLIAIDASHGFVARTKDDGSDYYVEFIFENINLPFDDANNDGYVVFKIKTLDTLVLNDTFENEAEIYFDFNFPIITNVAQTTVATLSTEDFTLANTSIVLYPNPTTDILHLKSMQAIQHISIYDLFGRQIQDIAMIGLKTNVDISTEALSTGTYFVKIKTETSELVKKFIKD
ncbi:DUF7619 domain-containing protein [Psychroserpens mesophilus]|uniref:DUF7619 domain-containing protein n=1 Tax=Psychroserpens mesophilus TaxID=325473 RepID=UPI003D64CFD3